MSNPKQLTKKQRDVIEDLFAGQADERDVLAKHKVDCRLYEKWLTDENFIAAFDRRLESARRQSDLIIARYATLAAAKLAQLTESENQETSRKACLDIIGLLRPDKKQPDAVDDEAKENYPQLAPELAGKLLKVLAEQSGVHSSRVPGPLGADNGTKEGRSDTHLVTNNLRSATESLQGPGALP